VKLRRAARQPHPRRVRRRRAPTGRPACVLPLDFSQVPNVREMPSISHFDL
jgi:hypothetical protein